MFKVKMSTDDSSNESESYQCLSGTPIISSKNKNKDLAENKNKKEPTKFKKVSDVTVPSIAYYPTAKNDQVNGQDNNFSTKQGNENGEHQTDSRNGVVEDQEYVYSKQVAPVFGAQQNSPETVQQSSICPCCVIM